MKKSKTNDGGATDDMIRVLLNDGGDVALAMKVIRAVLRNDDDKMQA